MTLFDKAKAEKYKELVKDVRLSLKSRFGHNYEVMQIINNLVSVETGLLELINKE